MEKHFVTFYSPGTFYVESTCMEIASWDVEQAKKMALEVKERYGATPYGFKFTTSSDRETAVNSNKKSSSPMYYLGGRVETYEMVLIRNDPNEEILRSNMQMNGIKRIIINTNSYKTTQIFGDDDVVLEFDPTVE